MFIWTALPHISKL